MSDLANEAILGLGDAERAAVMIMLLEEDQAAAILSQLGPDELQLLGEKMCSLGHIGPEQIRQAISHFVNSTQNQGISAHGRNDHVRRVMTKAVGDLKGESLMQKILPTDAETGPAIELARWLTPQALIPLVKGEHPQAIAVLLVQLDPKVAAEVLHSLDPEEQTQVIHRIGTLGPISGDTIAMLETLLEQRIAQHHGKQVFSMGGAKQAAYIINQAGKAAEERIMPELNKIDRVLAKAIESEMYKFEHLFALDAIARRLSADSVLQLDADDCKDEYV